MLNYDLRRIGMSTDAVTAEVFVWATADDTIRNVSVHGAGGRVWGPFDVNCTVSFSRVIPDIPRNELPVIARGTDCGSPPRTTTSIPFLAEERAGSTPFCPPPGTTSDMTMRPRESTACREAQERANDLRNQIIGLCREISLLIDRRNAYLAAWILASALAIAALIAAALIIVPFVKIALYIVAAVLAAIAVTFLVLLIAAQAEIGNAQARDAELRRQFREAIGTISLACCADNIRVPITEPTC